MRGILFGFLVATMCLCGGHGALADNDEDSDSESCQGNCPEENGGDNTNTNMNRNSNDSNVRVTHYDFSRTSSDSSSSSRAKGGDSESSSRARGGDSESTSEVKFSGNSNNRNSTGEQSVNINNPADDVEGAAKRMARHAESAARVRSDSKIGVSPCGDSTGLSVQTGVAGGGMATITEACRAFRLQTLQAIGKGSFSTTLATITHYAGWLPRTILHVASFGVLN